MASSVVHTAVPITPQDFIDAWVYEVDHDFEKNGESASWAPGFTGPRKWGEESIKVDLLGAPTSNLAISKDGVLIAVAVGNDILLYNASTFDLRKVLRGHDGPVDVVHFHHDGGLLASSGRTGSTRLSSTRLWDLREDGSHEPRMTDMTIIAEKAAHAAVAELEPVEGWSADALEAEEPRIREDFKEALESADVRRAGLRGRVFEESQLAHHGSYPFSHDGNLFYYAHRRCIAVAYDLVNRKERFRHKTDEGAFTSWIGESPDSRFLAIVHSHTSRILCTKTGSLVSMLKGSKSQYWSGTWSTDGKLFAVGAGDGKVRVYKAETGEMVHTLGGFSTWVRALDCPQGSIDVAELPITANYIAAGARDGSVRIFDISSGECHSWWQVDRKKWSGFLEVYELHYGPGPPGSGSIVGFKVGDGRLIVYDALRNIKWEFEQDMTSVRRVAGSGSFVFIPNGNCIISADMDGALRVWSLVEGS
jgi:WD40 repeat protein